MCVNVKKGEGMLTEFIFKLNPFNIYGTKTGVDELLKNPLKTNETLMEDLQGGVRRIEVPPATSRFWNKILFWLQKRLNRNNHLTAINRLISLFHDQLISNPPQKTENLNHVNHGINQLKSLKNDYGFIINRSKDSSFIDLRLIEIEQYAYSIFTYYYQLEIAERDQTKKEAFIQFQNKVKTIFQILDSEHNVGMVHAQFFTIAPLEFLKIMLRERLFSLDERLLTIQNILEETNDILSDYEGLFFVPHLKGLIEIIRTRLKNELFKLKSEFDLMIFNIDLNYKINQTKEIELILKCFSQKRTQFDLCSFNNQSFENMIQTLHELFNPSL